MANIGRTAHAVWRLQTELGVLMLGAPIVVALRTARAWGHGVDPRDREWSRMVGEKLEALGEAQIAWLRLVTRPASAGVGGFDVEGWRRAVRPYSGRVRRNVERLGRSAAT
jgi:hypothetical protein